MGLNDNLRTALEKSIDNFLKNPEGSEKNVSGVLIKQGIEPKLDTILSFLVGNAFGFVLSWYATKHQRTPTSDEFDDFNQLMKRRAWELRQAFIGTRIEK